MTEINPHHEDNSVPDDKLPACGGWLLLLWHLALIVGLGWKIWCLWPDVVPSPEPPQPKQTGRPVPRFQAADLEGGGKPLANLLLNAQDELPKHLNKNLDTQARGLVDAVAKNPDQPPDTHLAGALAQELNRRLADSDLQAKAKNAAASQEEPLESRNRRILLQELAPAFTSAAKKETKAANATEPDGQRQETNGRAEVSKPGDKEAALLLVVLASGGLGSALYAGGSSTARMGNNTMGSRWVGWYLLRPFIGMGMAFIFYCVTRGGLITPRAQTDTINVYVVAGLAGMVGLFSKAATDRLRRLFDAGEKPDSMNDGARNKDTTPAGEKPSIASLVPPKVKKASVDATLQVNGKNFTSASQAQVNGVKQGTTFVNASQLNVTLAPAQLAQAAKVPVIVVNPSAKGDVKSEPLNLEIIE